MRKNTRRWGFLGVLGSDQNPGGVQMSSDESRQDTTVHRKSRFGFKRRDRGVKPILLTDALTCYRSNGQDCSDIPEVAGDEDHSDSSSVTGTFNPI